MYIFARDFDKTTTRLPRPTPIDVCRIPSAFSMSQGTVLFFLGVRGDVVKTRILRSPQNVVVKNASFDFCILIAFRSWCSYSYTYNIIIVHRHPVQNYWPTEICSMRFNLIVINTFGFFSRTIIIRITHESKF